MRDRANQVEQAAPGEAPVVDLRDTDELDVVSRLRDHQKNLRPPAHPAQAVLLALPTPPICRVLHRALFERRRATALAALAAELGGGDGPLRIVDLDDDARPLPVVLDELRDGGIVTLALHGAADQPGLTRAVALRWPGALQIGGATPETSLLAPLMDDVSPVLELGAGVVRVRFGAAPPSAALVALVGVEDGRDPVNLLGDAPELRPYAVDPFRAAGCHSGFLPPAGLRGTPPGDQIRRRWHVYWRRQGQAESLRRAALGLEPALERRLAGVEDAPKRGRRAAIFVVTGIDGAGKSTHAAGLVKRLEERGDRAATVKIYRQGAFLELADELGGRTRRGAPLAAFRVSRIVKLIDSLRAYRDAVGPALDTCDALVMDRYTETHVAAAESQLGWDLRDHPVLSIFPPADRRAWLRVPTEEALERLEDRGDAPSADEHPAGLLGYTRVFDTLSAEAADDLVLDSRAPLEQNAAAVAEHMLSFPRSTSSPRAEARLEGASQAPASVDRATRCRVIIGEGEDQDDLPALGAEVFALRRLLLETAGPAAAGVPGVLWLEAYAAQLVLDLRTCPHEAACVPIWPAALHQIPGWQDLTMLSELNRLLDPLVEVAGYRTRPPRLLSELTAGPAAASRLCAAYGRALSRIAEQSGWAATDNL